MAESSSNSSDSNNNSENTNTTNTTTGNNSVGFSSAPTVNKTDVDAINKRATNQSDHSSTFRKRAEESKKKSKSKNSDLGDKEGLEDSNNSNNKNKDKDNKSKTGKSEKSKGKSESATDLIFKKSGIKGKIAKLKIKLIIAGIVLSIIGGIFLIAVIGAAYDALLDSISTFFGINENDPEESLLNKKEYLVDGTTGEYYSTDELVAMLKEDNQCSITIFSGVKDFIDMIDGTMDNFCTFTRYIQKRIEKWEKKHSTLTLDRALVISGLFYGYAAQPDYTQYIDSYNAPYTVSASEHYESLMDILKTGTLTREDLDAMIDNAIANHTHPYYQWNVVDYYNKKGKLVKSVGYCNMSTQEDVTYSLLRWQMFLRYGKDVVEQYDYLMKKKKTWEATSEECNGTVDDATLLAKVAASGAPEYELDYASINLARNDLKLGNPPNMELFEQKATTEGYEKDVLTPHVSNYGTVIFNYVDGFAYKRFPYFQRAYNSGATTLSYDDAITPKVIESLIHHSEGKKTTMNEILGFVDQDNPMAFSNFGTMWSSVRGAYCKDYVAVPFNEIEVLVKDCDGRDIGKTNFKDYIMGVAYGEVSDKHDDYVKSEMVAALSYALARRNNYTKVPTITMRSGNCDQVYCSMAKGCSSIKSTLDCGGFPCTSYYPGLNYSFYHGAAGDALAQKYSRLYDEASQFLLVKDGHVFSAGYVSSVQNRWYEMASSGMSFTQIMQETYGPEGAELVRCENLDNPGNSSTNNSTAIDDNSMGNGPSSESIAIKKVGNTINDVYDRVSPDLGKFYGYSYNDDPAGRDITINPQWINANIISLDTNWGESYRVNTQAKVNFQIAYKNINNILTNGVKLSDGTVCKYTADHLRGGTTFEQRKTSSGLFSESSYGITQSWNYNMSFTINDKIYNPYSKGSTKSDYIDFVTALGKEEDCRNINYVLYKYAYAKAGFSWGRYDDIYDGSLFRIDY